MSRKTVTVILLLGLAGLGAPALADDKRQLIDEMLTISGSIDAGRQMASYVANSMIDTLAKANDRITPEIAEVLKKEVVAIVEEEFIEKRFLNEMSYEIYSRYFSTEELRELVRFYQTDLGRKLTRTQPRIIQESTAASRNHMQQLKPEIQKRVRAALEREGVL